MIEAVLLADRVVVLSQRPARVIADIEVALDGPRDEAMTRTTAFKNLCDEVLTALEDTT